MLQKTFGRLVVAFGALMLLTTPSFALNETYESTCGPSYPCSKPPKENLCFKQYGDFDAMGAMGQAKGAVASLGNTFRVFNLRVNTRFAANFTIMAHFDSCPSGSCIRHATWYYDLDAQELNYPGEFYGQPLVITLDSARAVDNGSNYNVTICAQTLKKK